MKTSSMADDLRPDQVIEVAPTNLEAAPSYGGRLRRDFISAMGKLDGRSSPSSTCPACSPSTSSRASAKRYRKRSANHVRSGYRANGI